MTTTTQFAFQIDSRDSNSDNPIEQLAGLDDYRIFEQRGGQATQFRVVLHDQRLFGLSAVFAPWSCSPSDRIWLSLPLSPIQDNAAFDRGFRFARPKRQPTVTDRRRHRSVDRLARIPKQSMS